MRMKGRRGRSPNPKRLRRCSPNLLGGVVAEIWTTKSPLPRPEIKPAVALSELSSRRAKPSITVGSADKLPQVIDTLIGAVQSGELDYCTTNPIWLRFHPRMLRF